MHSHRNSKRYDNRVGLDIGSHTVHGVEILENGSQTVIRSAGSAVIAGEKSRTEPTDPAATIHAIRSLWSSAKFGSKHVVLAAPADAVYTKWLHIEAADEEELEQTALATATRGAHFSADDTITDYRILSARQVGSRTRYFVMLAAASSSAVDRLLDIVESAGMEPIAVDIGAAAALRSFNAQKRVAGPLWSDQPMAHCIVGARDTTITVIRGKTMEFSRTVPVGGNDFTDCLAENTGMSWAEADKLKMGPGTRLSPNGVMITPSANGEQQTPCDALVGRLAREINRSLNFFTSQFAEGSYLGMIGAITMSGGGALLRGLDESLSLQGVDIAGIVNPFAGFSVASESSGMQTVGDNAAAYTTAVGLATGDYVSDSPAVYMSVAA